MQSEEELGVVSLLSQTSTIMLFEDNRYPSTPVATPRPKCYDNKIEVTREDYSPRLQEVQIPLHA